MNTGPCASMQLCLLASCAGVVAAALVGAGAARAGDVTPAEWLRRQEAPEFRAGHTLPPLTRFGWTLPVDARVELAERWGYCLEFGGYATVQSVDKALADPESPGGRMIALAARDPDRYPLAVICSRELPKENVPAETFTRDAGGKFLDGTAKSMDGNVWHKDMKTIFSPEAPDSYWQEAAALRAEPIARIRKRCRVAVVLNGGEYGLNVLGFCRKVWELDPAVVKARGETPWFEYISERKARQEMIISRAVRAAVPDRQLYIYYPTTGGTHRNRWGGWVQWGFGYEWMKPVSDLASSEAYYRHFNTGWTGAQDLLGMVLNARGFEIANGQPLSYNWLCAGWPRKDPDADLSDIDRYEGFLKCFYTAGMVGGNAGYYTYPKGGFAAKFPADEPPHWLRQMAAFARVHALFSHLEDFARNGDLLPGPAMHKWSKEQPAYEFPTGDATARVVARRHRTWPEWLITAWAADGPAREVGVDIPDLGKVKIEATPGGTVYRAELAGGKARCEPVHIGGAHAR